MTIIPNHFVPLSAVVSENIIPGQVDAHQPDPETLVPQSPAFFVSSFLCFQYVDLCSYLCNWVQKIILMSCGFTTNIFCSQGNNIDRESKLTNITPKYTLQNKPKYIPIELLLILNFIIKGCMGWGVSYIYSDTILEIYRAFYP